MWPRPGVLHWNHRQIIVPTFWNFASVSMACYMFERKTLMVDLSEDIWNLTLQSLQTSYFHYRNVYGYQTWQGGDLPWRAPTHNITETFGHVVLQDHVRSQNHHNSITRVAVATKCCRMVTCFDGRLPKKSHDGFIRSSCEIPWQTKTIIPPLPRCLWSPNLSGWWLIQRVSKS